MNRLYAWNNSREKEHPDFFELCSLWKLLLRSPAHLRAVQFMFKFNELFKEYEDLHMVMPEFHPDISCDWEGELWDAIGVHYIAYEIQELIETLPAVPPLVVKAS